jgi:hypothetical protein
LIRIVKWTQLLGTEHHQKGRCHRRRHYFENASTITLATQLGIKKFPKSEIATREETAARLMPKLEALGAETLRDILAFICGDALALRIWISGLRRTVVKASSFARTKGGVVRLAKYGNDRPAFHSSSGFGEERHGTNIMCSRVGPRRARVGLSAAVESR